MKMSPEDYEKLETAMWDTLKFHNLHPYMVVDSGMAWRVFHKAWQEKRINGNELYEKYTDSHITTAMKKIFKGEIK